MTIIEVLTAIKEAGIKVSPFTNYDKVTEAEYADNGVSFKPNETEWPIHNISITSAGNLNISFEQEGVLTDKTTVNIDEIFSEKVKDFVGSLQKSAPGTAFPKMSEEEYRLYQLGLRPDGVYSKKATYMSAAKDVSTKVAIKGFSSKTTKAAIELKKETAGMMIPASKVNELVYAAKVLKIHADRASSCMFAGKAFTGTVKV